MADKTKTHENVQVYYGQTLQSSADLQTGCCAGSAVPSVHKSILALIEDEVLFKSYGCGSPIPDALDGLTALDLGCGTGRDVYLLSKLVGEQGRVIGVDMTDEQLDVARRHVEATSQKFGFREPNIEFHKGMIENLAGCGIADNSVDLIVSNCVLNLAPHKEKVFAEIFRVLKPGGELYFSDVYADRRIPQHLQEDPVFHGECLGGALYIEDFRRLLTQLGCPDYREVSSAPIPMNNDEMSMKAGNIQFTSKTIRAFKLASLEDAQEDYGQVATYRGTIEHKPHAFRLDANHVFERGRPTTVSGNTAAMLSETRLGRHFEVLGDRDTHFGAFGSRTVIEELTEDVNSPAPGSNSSGCC